MTSHRARTQQQDEYFCSACAKRWAVDEEEPRCGQTNPEQWAVELWRKAFAAYHGPTYVSPDRAGEVIQSAFAEREARLVGNEREAIINWLRGGAGTDTTTLAKPMRILFLRGLHSYADAIERGDHLAALKDRTHG